MMLELKKSFFLVSGERKTEETTTEGIELNPPRHKLSIHSAYTEEIEISSVKFLRISNNN